MDLESKLKKLQMARAEAARVRRSFSQVVVYSDHSIAGSKNTSNYQDLPDWPVIPLSGGPIYTVIGPNAAEGPEQFGNVFSGQAISSYPQVDGKGRMGDPICDRFGTSFYPGNSAAIAVADGCSWGKQPAEAAERSVKAFLTYFDGVKGIFSTKEAGRNLLLSFSQAHKAISEGKKDQSECGTTTLIGGLMLRLREPQGEFKEKDWVFLCCSIGDCKAFLISHHGEATDISLGSWGPKQSVQDPGGRLGPFNGSQPDLRNLTLTLVPCASGDKIILVTDGVHDNFSPEFLGKLPSDVLRITNHQSTFPNVKGPWLELDTDAHREIQQLYVQHVLKKLLNNADQPSHVVQRLLNYCWLITENSRWFVEHHPSKKMPSDYLAYPGKLDHSTATCLKIGLYDDRGNFIEENPTQDSQEQVSMTTSLTNLIYYSQEVVALINEWEREKEKKIARLEKDKSLLEEEVQDQRSKLKKLEEEIALLKFDNQMMKKHSQKS